MYTIYDTNPNRSITFLVYPCITFECEVSKFTVGNKAKMRFLSANRPVGLRMQKY